MHPLATPPPIQAIESIPLPQAQRRKLSNGVELYELRIGSQDIIKIEWLFDAGRWYEQKPLVARAAAQLLKSGTPNYSADELADFFDFYGAKFKISDDFDEVSVRLYCLTKHLPTLLPVVQELFSTPIYDQDELKKFAQRHKQALRLQLQKNDVLAYRVFTEELFGSKHPYGYNSMPAFYDALDRVALQEHHERCYVAGGCKLIVAGKTDDALMDLICAYAEQLPAKAAPLGRQVPPLPLKASKKRLPSIKSSTQASIRIGNRMIPKSHPDYPYFEFTNLLLGGYFGARLMQNLREDKGYTYSVYAAAETMRHSGYFYIYTDVNVELKEAALAEIYWEIERLQTEPVSTKELEMVKNYSLGMFLNAVDGVFNVSAIWKELLVEGLSPGFFDQLVQCITEITPQQIQKMARLYFNTDDLYEVLVG